MLIIQSMIYIDNHSGWLHLKVTKEKNAEEDNCNFPTYFDLSNLQVGRSVNNGSWGEHHQGVSGSQGGAGYASKCAKRGFPKCPVKVQSGRRD